MAKTMMKKSIHIHINDKSYEVEILETTEGQVAFMWEGKRYAFSLTRENGNSLAVYDENLHRHHHVSFVPQGNVHGQGSVLGTDLSTARPVRFFSAKGSEIVLFEDDPTSIKKKRRSSSSSALGDVSSGHAYSPMPGKIFKILKGSGEEVTQGETLLLMEAMKMEHAVKASASGIIEEICHKEQDIVALGDLLVKIKIKES